MTNADMVKWGLEQFLFSAKLVRACVDETISSDVFRPAVTMAIPGDVVFSIREYDAINKEELVKVAQNQMMVTMAASAIVTDEALSRRFGGKSTHKEWKRNSTAINALREVIWLIRSAYAHTMPDVHWRISNERRSESYTIQTPDGVVHFDATGKHNAKLEFAHFGGLRGYIWLVTFADDVLRAG